jgi:hypothetical protein
MMSQQLCLRLGGHHNSHRTVQLVGCETNITEILKYFSNISFYNRYCCLSTTSETLCGQLCQAPHFPPSPFLSATSLSSPVLLQIFASRIYMCSDNCSSALRCAMKRCSHGTSLQQHCVCKQRPCCKCNQRGACCFKDAWGADKIDICQQQSGVCFRHAGQTIAVHIRTQTHPETQTHAGADTCTHVHVHTHIAGLQHAEVFGCRLWRTRQTQLQS